jgi:hypothetical protein
MINGDNRLSWAQKILYFPQCIKGWYPKTSKDSVSFRLVNLKIINQETGTPSRRLCNMFWGTINWENLSDQLGDKVKLLEIGCGSGYFGLKFRDYLGKKFDSYTGLDIYKHVDFPGNCTHINDKAENIKDYIFDYNLVVSQSALEHIKDDRSVLVDLTNLQRSLRKPFLQIHLVPAPSSLFLYLWHGYRQYSSMNLGEISGHLMRTFGVKTKIIPLGSWKSFFTHFFYITIHYVIRSLLNKPQVKNWDVKNSALSSKISKAILHDRFSPNKIPSFWAYIIFSEEIEVDHLFE